MENASVTARLTGKEIKKIDSLISAGLYTTRSDFLRHAARHLLREEAPEIPELFLRLQAQAKEKGLAKDKILKDIRSVRRQLYREAFGDE
ncbi:MAG: ribbon-helix-helix domain-containing protein [Euryarchaeota archaeon]|nr:ribbon-helix-helix domain-containing protein [Euryarchaeota archaeon]